jgi:hypothetical protein
MVGSSENEQSGVMVGLGTFLPSPDFSIKFHSASGPSGGENQSCGIHAIRAAQLT